MHRFKIYPSAAMIIIAACLCLLPGACGNKPDNETLRSSDGTLLKEGFIGRDSCIIRGEAEPDKRFTDPEKRKRSSMQRALLQARYRIIERFYGSCLSGGCGDIKTETESIKQREYRNEVVNLSRNGKIVYIAWDSDQNCVLLYMVTKKGLKEFADRCCEVFR